MNQIILVIVLLVFAGCQSVETIEIKENRSAEPEILLNGEAMTAEQIDYYLENDSKRKTEVIITKEDGTTEKNEFRRVLGRHLRNNPVA